MSRTFPGASGAAGVYSRRRSVRSGGRRQLDISASRLRHSERGSPVPRTATVQASVLGLPNERFFPIAGTDPLEAEFAAAVQRLRRARGLSPTAPMPQVQLLAVSGGGENGAFGAGLLCGWSEHGSRPIFELVTGVSTGALTAPFAYLGPVMTRSCARSILSSRPTMC